MRTMNVIATALAALALASCSKDIEMKYPPKFELPELPELVPDFMALLMASPKAAGV